MDLWDNPLEIVEQTHFASGFHGFSFGEGRAGTKHAQEKQKKLDEAIYPTRSNDFL